MATVLRIDNAPAACSLWLNAPEVTAGMPGQFVMVKCEDCTLARPLGIAEQKGQALRLVFAVKGGGTRWLAQRQPGDELGVMGPLGHGFPSLPGRVLLIGGGLGTPPLLYATQQYDCDAALGFRGKEQALLIADFTDVCGQVAVATDDGSLGLRGNALAAAALLTQRSDYAAAFACGPVPLLRAAKAWCAERGLPCYVSLEERMACGVGACLVCACAAGGTYKRVCKDGPVFDAREVDFDA